MSKVLNKEITLKTKDKKGKYGRYIATVIMITKI